MLAKRESEMTTSDLKVVQIYSGTRGAQIAGRACDRFRRDFDSPGLAQTVWNTELLRSPKLRLLAAREAAEADVVLIALDEDTALSKEILAWLRLWRCRTRSTRSTLVALLRRESISSPRVVQASLHTFATAANMDFFCHSQVDSKPHRSVGPGLVFVS
jgi:hypothetical protein